MPTVFAQKANNVIGDAKHSMQAADHNGFILLDGRLKASLTATQQAAATNLGIGANIPDASNAVFLQTGAAIGLVAGSNSKTLLRSDLPNVTLGGTAATAGNHTKVTFNVSTAVESFTRSFYIPIRSL